MDNPTTVKIYDEARRLIDAGNSAGVSMRLIGGLAIRAQAGGKLHPALERVPKDIDLVVSSKDGRKSCEVIESSGYEPSREFNALNAGRRALFFDTKNGWQIDLFVGEFAMCHRIPLGSRLDLVADTAPLAELLLMKLQVIEVNRKDLSDAMALLLTHPVADYDEGAINGLYIAQLCAADWGLWRTITMNLRRTVDALSDFELSAEERETIVARIGQLLEAIEAEPKSRRWRLRDRIGDRKQWYGEPEEPDADLDI